MPNDVYLRSEDGIKYEVCSYGEQFANSFNLVIPSEELDKYIKPQDDATESDYIDALQDLGVELE